MSQLKENLNCRLSVDVRVRGDDLIAKLQGSATMVIQNRFGN
jgi:hypothetical protein